MKWNWFKRNKRSGLEFGFDDSTGNTQQTVMTPQARLRSWAQVGLLQLSAWFQVKAAPLLKRLDWALISNTALILTLTFAAGTSLSTIAANSVINQFSVTKKALDNGSGGDGAGSGAGVTSHGADVQVSSLRAAITSRNIFNSSGELPPEADEQNNKLTKTKGLNFELVPCSYEKFPVEVVGIIATGDAETSVVIAKDPKVAETDMYKPGSLIIDHEEYEVYKIAKAYVELRKGDQKICLDMENPNNNDGAGDPGANGGGRSGAGATETIELAATYVAEQMGAGGAALVNSIKFIPEIGPDRRMQGFKILSIPSGSLFDKMKLQNGDVVVVVNGKSLLDGDGSILYEALQMERRVTIGILRNGEPMTREVLIR